MSKLKLSPLHDINIDPVHVGVYKMKMMGWQTFIWSYWCGKQFHGCWTTIKEAYDERSFVDYDEMFIKNRLQGCALDATAWQGIIK